jgi:signal peptidase I
MTSLFREVLEAVVMAVLVFILIQTSLQNFKVEGYSMRPTLLEGQYLLVNKLVYFRLDQERLARIVPFWRVNEPEERFAIHPPHRGEVIVFHFPEDPTRDFVKRVIGVPGDRISLRNGEVFLNGSRLEEPYITSKGNSNANVVVVEEKEYFVLGDNRRGSNDSRNWGPVPEENILGKVWLVYWPPSMWQVLE